MKNSRKLVASLTATALCAGALASPAVAGAPKQGKYECVDLSYWVNLKSATKYTATTMPTTAPANRNTSRPDLRRASS